MLYQASCYRVSCEFLQHNHIFCCFTADGRLTDCFLVLRVAVAGRSPVDVLKCNCLKDLSALMSTPWQVMDTDMYCMRIYALSPIQNQIRVNYCELVDTCLEMISKCLKTKLLIIISSCMKFSKIMLRFFVSLVHFAAPGFTTKISVWVSTFFLGLKSLIDTKLI